MRVRTKEWGGSHGFIARWVDSRGQVRTASSNGFATLEEARARGEMFRVYGAEEDPVKRRELKRVACTSAHCGCSDDAGAHA